MQQPPPPPGEDPWQTTSVVKTLWPPQAGTVKLRRQYGWQLVCVRYRRDMTNHHRYTTVELVVDHATIAHRPLRQKMLEIRVGVGELDLRRQLQAVGGVWDLQKKVWRVEWRTAKALGLLKKVVKG